MKKTLPLIAMMMLCVSAMAQSHVTLLFTCRTADNRWVRPDSITVENLTRGWVETLEYPDTLYMLNVGVGIETVDAKYTVSLQTASNPFNGTTTVNLQMPEPGDVRMEITDIQGRMVRANKYLPQRGINQFRISLSTPGIYMLTAHVNGKTLSAKLVNTGNGGKDDIEYNGTTVETQNSVSLQQTKSDKGSSTHAFQLGDQMRYVAYFYGIVSEGVTHSQSQSEEITLIFTTPSPAPGDAVPCPEAPTITDYDGNVYNTVKIGNQCWMRKNLRTTHYANGGSIPAGSTSTGSPANYTDPYYYSYTSSGMPLEERGYLYNWAAVMHGASSSDANPSGVQGICPNGWHVPSNAEWTQLVDYVSSQSQYVCGDDNKNIAKALSSTTGWISGGHYGPCQVNWVQSSNNATGFSAVPAGILYGPNWEFDEAGEFAFFWSSTLDSENPDVYASALIINRSEWFVRRGVGTRFNGLPVRCLRN